MPPFVPPLCLHWPMKLTDVKLRSLDRVGKHSDGGGLYLELTVAGGRYWRMKYRFAGKEKRLAFGVYPEVGLKDARERRDAARRALDCGQDPGALRKEAKARIKHEAANTFEAVARDWLAHQAGRWQPITLRRTRSSLEADIFPLLGNRPMASISARDVMHAVKRIEERGAGEMATRVLQRVKAAFRYAVTHQRIDSNPIWISCRTRF
ncbi:tyrosine-type recombinase/integrase [Variovorax ginsengisoli]|uniref:Core-binding (CB) domain-containing protein n=1 Tax=Variovorax ginsengisoli TaxID=363844 RepID=A0ABT9SAQ4_9BURK|nr:hypothetical protein [Variovorax ginsengisoli]